MAQIKYVGGFPMEVLHAPGAGAGTVRHPGEVFEVNEEAAADLLRRPEYFEAVEEE